MKLPHQNAERIEHDGYAGLYRWASQRTTPFRGGTPRNGSAAKRWLDRSIEPQSTYADPTIRSGTRSPEEQRICTTARLPGIRQRRANRRIRKTAAASIDDRKYRTLSDRAAFQSICCPHRQGEKAVVRQFHWAKHRPPHGKCIRLHGSRNKHTWTLACR